MLRTWVEALANFAPTPAAAGLHFTAAPPFGSDWLRDRAAPFRGPGQDVKAKSRFLVDHDLLGDRGNTFASKSKRSAKCASMKQSVSSARAFGREFPALVQEA